MIFWKKKFSDTHVFFISFTKSYVINYIYPLGYITVIVNTINERYLLSTPITALLIFSFVSILSPSTNLPTLFTDDSFC